MHAFVKRHVVWSWIAALAILFGAVAPTLSRAMAADAERAAVPDAAMEVCTMLGMKMLPPADHGGKPDPGKFDHMLDHCPYCAAHAVPALLPPPSAPFVVPRATYAVYPLLFYRSATTSFAWSPARPRGPPVPL